MRRFCGIAAIVASWSAVVLSLGVAPAGAHGNRHAGPKVRVVASGLNNPKHLTFGPGGLYVAESGTGGPVTPDCVNAIGTQGAPTSFCEGPTGSVSLLTRWGKRTVLSGLPSVTEQDNQETLGPSAVTFAGGGFLRPRLAVLFQDVLVNADGTTSVPGGAPDAFGKLMLATRPRFSPAWPVLADVAAFASANPQSPDTLGGIPGGETTFDSDPYDVVPYRGGYAIADAAANSVLWLSPHGHLSMLARLPTTPETIPAGALGPGSPALDVDAQAVPTSIAVGRDGALYVGTLRGVPSLPGTADVFRVVPGRAPVAAVTGLTSVTDVAFDHEGRLLVLEFNIGGLLGPPTNPGALLRVTFRGHHSPAIETLPVSGLSEPTGLAVGPGRRGVVYISNHGTSPGTATPSGEVLRVSHLG